MNQPIFALIDCNNFFVSCERIFRPDLEHKPVIVLSSNDGCAVARSNEVKALGIPMGAPAFKCRDVFEKHGVVPFSANFDLYGNISDRIITLLTSVTPRLEVYSVDESFLDLSQLHITDYAAWAADVRQRILQYIGVPVSIGIASSKTLAKLAAERAKKAPGLDGVLSFIDQPPEIIDQHLAATPIADIWGIGWRLAPKLRAEGVHTALNMRQFPTPRASKLMGVHGRQLVAELNGTSCKPLERPHKPQQQIMRGRQFGEDTSEFHVIEAAIASLTARAAATLRAGGQLACVAGVTIRTNRHKPGYHQVTKTVHFATPTADTGIISGSLVRTLQAGFNPRESYHKADVFLYDIILAHTLQTDLFDTARPAIADASRNRMQTIDAINNRYGAHRIGYAAESLSQSWRPRHRLGSPRYTTRWDELPEVT